ncbi:MAG: sulfurase [Crocinitomicaceae bacterium]|nr:sulfurase [Crocinitomicaceae bacterium]|tara:strand:- start:930 stop:1388 length:459 start_codon:yes stop_codon:yes gene_type:complete
MPKVVSININENGGVPKYPVDKAFIGKHKLTGDKQNDTVHHGGIDRAVCIFSMDLISNLQKEGHPIFAGSTGENITIEGLDWKSLKIGIKLKFGEVEIQLTNPTTPCKTIAKSFKNNQFIRISEKKYPGWSRWYARVLKEGIVSCDDKVLIL